MKAFLSTLKGKIIAGVAGAVVIGTGIILAVVILNSGHRTIAVNETNGQTIITNEKDGTKDAYKGMHLVSGDDVKVTSDANMTMLLDADKYVFAKSGTHFWVEATGKSGKNGRTKIYLDKGSILNRLDNNLSEEEYYEVETPNATMAVRGTIFRVTVYEDSNGETFTRIDVLEGEVKVTLKMEDGTIKDENAVLTKGQSALVRSNPDLSEFVVGETDIPYEEFDKAMARFIVETIDTSRPICIDRDLFIHYTELYKYYDEIEEHTEEEKIVKEASCSEEGIIEIYCNICGEVVREDAIEKLSHQEGEWTVLKEATCKEAGEEALLCSVCNGVIESKEIEKLQHVYVRRNQEVREGCVVHNNIQNVCNVCGDIVNVQTTDVENHKYGDWKIVLACTCSNEGLRQRVCSSCGDIIEEKIQPDGHNYGAWTTVVASTCEKEGTRQRKCSNCSSTIEEKIAASSHSYGAWTTVVEANCGTGATGTKSRVCSNCSKSETEIIQPSHTWSNWSILKNATCEAEGLQQRYCTTCQSTEELTISTLDHVWVNMPDGHRLDTDSLRPQAGTQQVEIIQVCENCFVQGPSVNHTVTLTEVMDDNGGTYFYCVCECGITGEIWPD